MKKKLVMAVFQTFLVVSIFYIHSNASDFDARSNLNVIGIFTHCHGNSSQDNEPINYSSSRRIADVIKKTIFDGRTYYLNALRKINRKSSPLIYQQFLTCDSMNDLTEILSNIILNETFAFKRDEICTYKSYGRVKTWQGCKVLIISYLSEQHTKLLVALTAAYNIKVRSYSPSPKFPSVHSPYYFPFYSDFAYHGLKSFIEDLKVKNIEIILAGALSGHIDLKILGEKLFKYFSNEPHFCVKLYSITRKDNDQYSKQYQNNGRSLVVFLGIGQTLNQILRSIQNSNRVKFEGHNNNTWIYYPKQNNFPRFPGLFTLEHRTRNVNSDLTESETFYKEIEKDVAFTLRNFYVSAARPLSGVSQLCNWNYQQTGYFNNSRGLVETYQPKGITTEEIQGGQYSWEDGSTWKQDKTVCPGKNICPPGKENLFGIHQTDAIRSRDWYCKACPNTQFKAETGTGGCRPCSSHTLPNMNRSSCYDPFKDEHFIYSEQRIVIIAALNGITVIFCIVIAIVYIWHRKTPMIRVCDKYMTIFEITKILTICALIPFMFIGKMSIVNCTARPIIIGLLTTFHNAIMLTKSYKLYQIFNSMIRLNRRDYAKTSASQIFVIFMLLCIDAAVLLTAFWKQPVAIVTILDHHTHTRTTYCNSNPIIIQQIPFYLIVMILCLYQAYRCRNFPDNYNESMNIIYSMFTSFILFSVLPILYYTGKEEFDKEVAIMFVFVIGNSLLLFINFGWRCFVVVFKSKRNTRQRFRENCMQMTGLNKE